MDDERHRQRARRAPGGGPGSDPEPPPSSTRGADPRLAPGSGRTGAAPTSTRSEELAQLYRKLGDAQAASEAADEMVGQMLARVGEVEARLRAAQKQATDADFRAASAEARAADLGAQLGKLRSLHTLLGDEAHALETRLEDQSLELERTLTEMDDLCREAETLRTRITREQEERESLRARVTEFAAVCEERDTALAREELLEADLATARGELEAARAEVADLRGNATDLEGAPPRLRAPVESALHLLGGLERRELEMAHFRAGALSAARNLIESALGRTPSSVAAPMSGEQPVEAESGVIPHPGADADPPDEEPTHLFASVVKRR